MSDSDKLRQDVINALRQVIDPETGADVIRMRLVLELRIHTDGTAQYIFRPFLPLMSNRFNPGHVHYRSCKIC